MKSVYEILRAKRDGKELSREEIAFLVAGVVSGEVPDYQAAAFLMAAVIRGLSTPEMAALTEAMRDSGDSWDLSDLAPVVDKHSTGGVGDKATLVLAPLVAAAGGRVGMMSGRGLGHTGGTLDKLAAIPGFRTDLDLPRVRRALTEVGAALFAQTDTVAPADRKLYALRDVTGTVESLGLIVASILSKKLASGTTGIVFDVKTGNGAFLKTVPESRALGRALVDTSRAAGREASGWITDMSRPLGRAVGNALEAEESILVLRNEGPPAVRELCLVLGADMLRFAEPALSEPDARRRLEEAFTSGKAAERFAKLVEFQGGDPRVVEDPSILPQPKSRIPAAAPRSGFVRSIQTEKMGFLSIDIGCGRRKREDDIDFAAGFLVEKTVGDRVEKGEPLAILCLGERPAPRPSFERELADLFEIGDEPAAPPALAIEKL
ncbi:MAG: thymidine phosphorylase [Acidobacteria bacterium]|nr:thymidine phosphorylase [Acidobacteriota bacterium]MCA1609486.1 thymidine phosphorylase [Acidobacteriota bacterium]